MALARPDTGWQPRIVRAIGQIREKLGDDAVLPDETLVRLALFHERVVEWNARTDLTAARNADELVDLLVADAAVLALHAEGVRWVDVGSGAGAPGLPLSMLRPRIELTLVESKARRAAFLRSMVGELGLRHVSVERIRAEALPDAAWQTAVSRATLPAPDWLALGTRLAAERVWVLVAKTGATAPRGWKLSRDIGYRWPLTGVERRALCFSRER